MSNGQICEEILKVSKRFDINLSDDAYYVVINDNSIIETSYDSVFLEDYIENAEGDQTYILGDQLTIEEARKESESAVFHVIADCESFDGTLDEVLKAITGNPETFSLIKEISRTTK